MEEIVQLWHFCTQSIYENVYLYEKDAIYFFVVKIYFILFNFFSLLLWEKL